MFLHSSKSILVGILNITPDSFSDGGKFIDIDHAKIQTRKMLSEGAGMIDIGAQSTRPGAKIINDHEEWERLEKILPEIIYEVKKFNKDNKKEVETSIDSYHFSTIKKSYDLGIDVINDVSGLNDYAIIDFIAKNNIKTILMHSLSIPANPDIIINQDLDVVKEIIKFASEKIDFLIKKGVKKSQLIFDPGVGFAKNASQSLRIVKNVEAFRILNIPLYIGHSKKSFLDIIKIDDSQVNNMPNDHKNRLQKTLIISKYLATKNVNYIRVHDVLENKNAILNKIPLVNF